MSDQRKSEATEPGETRPHESRAGFARSNAVIILLAAAGILGGLAILFAVLAGYNPFARKITVTTYFKNSLNLRPGASVNLNGIAVGSVKQVTLSTAPEHRKAPVEVTMSLDAKYLSGLHTDSLAELTSMGALANTFIDIDSKNATGPPPEDGAEMPTLNTPTVLNLKATQETADDLHHFTDRLNTLFDEAETGKGTIGQLLSNPGLTQQAAATGARVKRITQRLGRTDSTAGKLLNDHSLTDKFADIGANMQAIESSSARYTSGPLQQNIAAVQSQANSLTADVHAGRGGVGLLTNDPAFKAQLNDTTAQAKAAIASIHTGNGTAAKLLSPDGMQVDLNKLSAESSALAAMIRQNPRKYLTIEIRIF